MRKTGTNTRFPAVPVFYFCFLSSSFCYFYFLIFHKFTLKISNLQTMKRISLENKQNILYFFTKQFFFSQCMTLAMTGHGPVIKIPFFFRSFFSLKLSTICKNETPYSSKMDRISFSLSYTVVKSHTFLEAK